MAKATDKVILTNSKALKNKYGASGLNAIRASLTALVVADKARGLQTQVVLLDDPVGMKKLSAPAVKLKSDPRQNKKAIDAVYKSLAPDYLMILGSYDVVPHQDLKNPLYTGPQGDDPDEFAYGDLPYACEAPYSQEASDFVGPTRVLSRLPDITGGGDPAYLIGLLETAAGYKPFNRESLMKPFAVTAQIWKASTKLSVTNAFENANGLQNVPPKNYKWKSAQLSRLAHFFNCHGADQASQFYGQPSNGASDYPPAMDAKYVAGKISEGVIVAAECCYGGQLYPTTQLVKQIGICNTYLANKCYGFFASTTIAYGTEQGNGQADYLCQFFMKEVASGASVGRAALQARQQFVKVVSPPDPSDIKTLAQFNLYGDPSVTPVLTTQATTSKVALSKDIVAKSVSKFKAKSVERKDRRRGLYTLGVHIAQTEMVPRRTTRKAPPGVVRSMGEQARALGWERGELLSFSLRAPSKSKTRLPKTLTSASELPTAYHVLFKRRSDDEQHLAEGGAKIFEIAALVAKEVNGEITSVSEIRSR